VRNLRAGRTLRLASALTARILLSPVKIDPRTDRRVEVKASALFEPGWKSVLWAAYCAAYHNGQQVSARTLRDLTGIPTRTQDRYQRFVRRTHNIGVTDAPAPRFSDLRGVRENVHPLTFPFHDEQRRQRVCARPLPATRTVSPSVAKPTKERRKHHRPFIDASRRSHNPRNYSRLFYKGKAQMAEAGRLMQAQARSYADPPEIFTFRRHGNGYDLWDVRPLPRPEPKIIRPTVRKVANTLIPSVLAVGERVAGGRYGDVTGSLRGPA